MFGRIPRKEIVQVLESITKLHDLFSCAYDSQHAYLDMAEHCIKEVLEDRCYGSVAEEGEDEDDS